LDPSDEGDKELCQAFECGSGRAVGDVRRWITKWLWAASPADQGETILFIDRANGALAGFGTWMHRQVQIPTAGSAELVIMIEWIGVATAYQGQRTSGWSIPRTILETLEARAREHPDSTADMVLIAEVDVDNRRAQDVWEHFGFRFFEVVDIGPRRYNRLIRSASE